MSSSGLAFGRSHGVLLSRLLWPTGILFAASLWIVFSTILWTSDSVNELAAERQRGQLSSAIDQQLASLRGSLADFAASQGPVRAGDDAAKASSPTFAQHALGLRDFDTVALVRPDWTFLGGVSDGLPATGDIIPDLQRRVETLVGSMRAGDGQGQADHERGLSAVARLLADASGPYAAVVVPTGIGTPASAGADAAAFLVGIRRLDTASLAGIAAFHGLGDFRLTREPPSAATPSMAIESASGPSRAWMTWSADRPGDLMRERLIPLTLTGFCVAIVLFGLVAGYLHWIAQDLARTEARSRDLLGRDPLSGLANRLLFSEQLDRELARLSTSPGSLAVHFIDLDRFKDVNDTYGHQAGDRLIQLVAQRLINLLRATDTLARFGGDEFAIIQTGIHAPEDAGALARRILDSLCSPFSVAHSQVTIGASIGIALAPQNGSTREVLMGLADTALYQAKGEGRNRFSFFQSRMDETIRMRKVVEEDLLRAIQEDQLVLHYQPLYSSDGVTVAGVEALVRWPHPTRGMIGPGEFIPVAEERGLVIPLGEWVLRRACRDGTRWPGIRIAVNVSPIQFRHRDFVSGVVAMLEETGLEASRLELELTEGVVVEDADAAETAMMELRALGVHLALDDFGTGYSSLIYLRRFAFDTIKIDRSFLESMEATGESAILVHSMVHLGRALGLTVTAEGVETREQHRFLQALGCHQLQGYLFSKPVRAEKIDALVAVHGREAA